ncbi:hypothetical protein MBM_09275 [Drepanopeziza brunnea f. sp. 'multigermtubi' MB_m1]|uniref:Uncharacterized protein n=1 Tax=Marssonina brunnea f. sp. multigermtubi (strain MB_m1) TaxID=1072389 RepID=K1XJ95_MARBU|nr:uncharacterized protein MBM_09275 [Drepanopeziza brunnea f. sp. 'multigermtubi' MB_m1]EKD12519.1 hypothetical protein MBM_09275 [Drepanopeziza brunnea f. sp. 'multigermtubi' MB_m1]
MPFKQVTQSNRIVKRGRSRLKNLLFALAIAAATAKAVAAIILRTFTFELRTFTFEASLFSLNPFIKRLLMLTTVKALKCINNCTVAFTAANTAFDNFIALNAAFLRSVANSPGGLTSKNKGFKSSPGSLASFALAFKTFNLNIAFIRLNSSMAANRNPVTQSASSILFFPAFALALAAFIAPVASATFVALIIVAFFTLVIALAAFTAALAVAITLTERRIKVKRLLRALIDLLL